MSQRVLIIGSDGQLGGALADVFRVGGDEVILPPRTELDIENADTIEKIVVQRPDVVINTAWFPVVDCEKDPTRAYHVNALGAYHVAKGAMKVGAVVVYISTDYVFDGSKEEGFVEDDHPHPLNVYGASKHAGEELTAVANPRCYIVRTSSLFGFHAKPLGNFVLKMKARAEREERTKVVNDQITCPTFAEDLAPVIREIIERGIPFGVYHVTNSGSATWHELTKEIFEKAGKPSLLEASMTVSEPEEIVRPKWSILQNRKLTTLGFPPLPHWKDALRRYLKT